MSNRRPGRPGIPALDLSIAMFLSARGRSYAHIGRLIGRNRATVFNCVRRELERQGRDGKVDAAFWSVMSMRL